MEQEFVCISNETTFGKKQFLYKQKQLSHISIHPLEYCYCLKYQFFLNKNHPLDSIKTKIYFNLKEYLKILFCNFLPYAYQILQRFKKEELKIQSKIRFKEFVSRNIIINLVSMTHGIKRFYIGKISSQDQQQLFQQWLWGVIQNLLKQNIEVLQEIYPQSLQNSSNNSSQLKKNVKLINNIENEQYDIFLLNDIKYTTPTDLIFDILLKVNQMCSNGYKLTKESHQNLKTEMSLMFEYLFMPQPSISLADHLQYGTTNLEAKCKIKEEIIFQYGSNISQFMYLAHQPSEFKKLSPFLRIMTKFIQNIHSILQNPQMVTIKRNYNYKSIDNQLIYYERQLNLMLHKNLLKLRDELIRKRRLQYIKNKIYLLQSYYLFTPNVINIHNPYLYFSKHNFGNVFDVTFFYLQQIIQQIIKAGEVLYKGRELKINLLRFNLGDLFRIRKTVTPQQFSSVMKNIYQIQNPTRADYLESQKIFKLIRIKDKTQTDAKGVLINAIFKNKVPCQIQINTKQDTTNSLYQICHELFSFTREKFGILNELLNIIAIQQNEIDPFLTNFKQCQDKISQSILKDFCQQKYKPFSENNEVIDQLRLNQLSKVAWKTELFQKTEIEIAQSKQRIQYINQANLFILTNQALEKSAYNHIKYILIDGSNITNFFPLNFLNRCQYLQRISIHNYDMQQRRYAIKDFSFIKSTGFIKTLIDLDLSNNLLKDFQYFSRLKSFQCLKKLNLSYNRYAGRVNFMPQWFPILQNLELSRNSIRTFHIDDDLTLTKDINHQLVDQKIVIKHDEKQPLLLSEYNANRIVTVQTNDEKLYIFVNKLKEGTNFKINMLNQTFDKIKQPSNQQLNTKDSYQTICVEKEKDMPLKQRQIQYPCFQRQFLHLSKYQYDFHKILKKMSGKITNRRDNSTFPCILIGNSNIILTPAHFIIHQYERKFWKNEKQQKIFKKTIIQNLLFFSAQSSYKKQKHYKGEPIQYMWICEDYILNCDLKKSFALLFLSDNRLSNKASQNNEILYYFNQNNQEIYELLLTGMLFNMTKFQGLSINITSMYFKSSNNTIQIVSLVPKTIKQTITAYCLRKIDNNYEAYIVGIFKEQKEKIPAIVFSNQFRQEYQNMVNSLLSLNIQTQGQFINYIQFNNRISRFKTLKQISSQTPNIFPFLSKFFKKVSEFLSKYLFPDARDFPLNNDQLLEHIIISHYYAFNENQYDYYVFNKNEYEIDIFECKIVTIFDYSENSEDYLDDIQKCQLISMDFIKKVLLLIKKKRGYDQSHINLMIHYLDKQMPKIKQTSISLIKILLFAAQVIDYSSVEDMRSQFQKQLRRDGFADENYFKQEVVLPKFSILKRIQYFVEFLRVTRQYHDFQNILDERRSSRDKRLKYIEKKQRKVTQIFKEMNEIYYQRLHQFVGSPQNKQYFTNQEDSLIQRMFYVTTMSKYYQIDLSYSIYQDKKQFDLEWKYTMTEKIKMLITQNMKSFNIFQQRDIQQLQQMFIHCIQKQLYALNKTLKIILLRSYRQEQIGIKQPFLSQIRKIYENPPIENKKKNKFRDPFQLNYQAKKKERRIIKKDVDEEKVYNNIGILLICKDLQHKSFDNWIEYACGTATIIQDKIAVTAAHLIKPILLQKIDKRNIKFLIFDKNEQNTTIIDVEQIRFLKDHNVAFLILQSSLPYSRLPLVSFSKSIQSSVLKDRHLFCRLIGYDIDKKDKSCTIIKFEGLICIQSKDKVNFRYKFQSYYGQQGGIIVFFPTGNLDEPYILGIHTKQYKDYSEGIFDDFISDKYSCGTMILFSHINQQKYQIISLNNNKSDIKIPTVSDLSSQFSESTLFMGKWRLINNLSKMLNNVHTLNRNVKVALIHLKKCWNNGIVIQKIHEDNILCYDPCFFSFFDVEVTYEKKKDKKMKLSMIMGFEDFMNRSFKHSYASEIVQKYIKYIPQLGRIASIQLIEIFYSQFMKQMKRQIDCICKIVNSDKQKDKEIISMFRMFQQLGLQVLRQTSIKNIQPNLMKLFQLTLQYINNDKQRHHDCKRITRMKKLAQDNERQQFVDNYSDTDSDKMKNVANYFNNELYYIEYLCLIDNKQYQELNVVKFQMQKILHEVTYLFYTFCFERHIKLKKTAQQERQFQLFENLVLDTVFQQASISQKLSYFPICKIIERQMLMRRECLIIIDELTFLKQDKRRQLARLVFNWEDIYQNIRLLLVLNKQNIDNKKDKAAFNKIKQIIVRAYAYQQRSFTFDVHKVLLDQLTFFEQTNITLKLDKKISDISLFRKEIFKMKENDC